MRQVKYAAVLLVLAQAWVSGCSSAETPNDPATGGSSGTGGATGGTGGSAAGTGGSGTGGSTGGTGTGGGAGVNTDPNCKGIGTGDACPNVGLNCSGLVCGLGDSGSRTCDCTGTWACTACNWDNTTFSWAMSKPADITTCLGTEQDRLACPTLHATCEGAANGEACVCYIDDEGDQVWDCDKPPGTWAAAAN